MYYILRLPITKAIGPFPFRLDAYLYAAKLELSSRDYVVQSDAAMQRDWIHVPIEKPIA